MEQKEKIFNEILAWFESTQDIKEGMKLHTRYSKNYSNKRKLALDPANRKKFLIMYMKELLDIYKPVDVILPDKEKQEQPGKKVYKESIGQRLSKEFPKLVFNDLPDTLKLLVIKRYSAWEESKKWHTLQHEAEADDERFVAAKNTVEAVMENWQIWEELEHYQKYNKILGNHPKFKEDEFLSMIKELEKKAVNEYVKEFASIRRRARNNIHNMLRKGKLNEKQEQILNLWIYKHDIVSTKLGEPSWEESKPNDKD